MEVPIYQFVKKICMQCDLYLKLKIAKYIPLILGVVFFLLFWLVWQYSWTFNNTMNVNKYLDSSGNGIPSIVSIETKQFFNIITISNFEASWRDQILSDMNYPYRNYTPLVAMTYDSDYNLQYLNWISALFLGVSMSCLTFYIARRDKESECAKCEI